MIRQIYTSLNTLRMRGTTLNMLIHLGPIQTRNLLRNMMNRLGRVHDAIVLFQCRINCTQSALEEHPSRQGSTFRQNILNSLIA